MSNTSSETTSTCANCGKGEEASNDLKYCTACKLVKYCNRECQIAHRPQHKKECKKRAAELHDEKLFETPPPLEDCPICFLILPHVGLAKVYMARCGKMICRGCSCAPVYDDKGNVVADLCPFCRTPPPKFNEEYIKQYEKRMELNDPIAIYNIGCFYNLGQYGLPQNYTKALELWHQAGELGFAVAYSCIGNAYNNGRGVIADEKKALHYWKLAALGGDAEARHNLGAIEEWDGNHDRAIKHYMIVVARDGYSNSLKNIKGMYTTGDATKDEYAKALHSYQVYLDKVKSDQRDEAAAASNEWKYLESPSPSNILFR